MMKKIAQMVGVHFIILVLLITLVVPVFAENNQASFEENPTVDFVIVIDCSSSMRTTDPDMLCNAACKMFLDMLPLENARISIVGFGNREGRPYALQSRSGDSESSDIREAMRYLDFSRVHAFVPLTNVSALRDSGIPSIKAEVDNVMGVVGDHSPMGAAVVSAVDLLESNGATDGNACIIVLSDGDNDDYRTVYNDQVMSVEASKWAGSHGWPMYTLQLNKNNQLDRDDVKRMQDMAKNSGAGGENEGHYNLTDFSSGKTDVAYAFINIFNRFMGGGGTLEEVTTDASGNLRESFQVESLTSEMTIVAVGSGVDDIHLIAPNGTELSAEQGDYELTVESDRYVSAKLICPVPGEWTALIQGDSKARLVMYQCSMRDMNMVLSSSVADLTAPIAKDKYLYFTIDFQYHGKPVPPNQEFFEQIPAVLVAENLHTGASYEFTELEPNAGGYTTSILMADLLERDGVSDGSYRFYAKIEDPMFRSGAKVSNALEPFKTNNEPVSLKDPNLPDIIGFVFSPVSRESRIDLNAHVNNPDGDVLSYDLFCASDRSYKVQWTIDNDNYLYITDCGNAVGEYTLQLTVREPNGDPLAFEPFQLTVQDHEFLYEDIPPVRMLTNALFFQHEPDKSAEFNLADYYYDPDGQPPIFSNIELGDSNGKTYQANYNESTHTISFSALGKGTDSVQFTVSDGYSEKQIEIPVEVVTGWELLIATLLPFWWVLVVIVVLIFALIVANKLTRVKGTWDLTLEFENGDYAVGTFDIAKRTRSGKKKQFLLKDLLLNNNLLDVMEVHERDEGAISAYLPSYFTNGTGADKIAMKGVLAGKGCTFIGIPANHPNTKVRVNGLSGSKKASFKAGQTTIEITPEGAQALNVIMTLK